MEELQSLTIGQALVRYRGTITPTKKSAPSEVYRIGNLLRSPIAEVKLVECLPYHVAAHRDLRLAAPHPQKPGTTIGPATVKHELMLLSHLFTVAVNEWGIDGLVNPVSKVRKPKVPPGRIRRLKRNEEVKIMRALRSHPNKDLMPLVILALETAARQGELLGLRWENISFGKRVAHLPTTKNGDSRDVPLTKRAVEALRLLGPRSEGAVFAYNHAGIKSAWRSLMGKLGIEDLHFHDLRHESISMWFERGLDAIEVSMISGHRSMQMIKRYTHLSAHKLVAKIDKLERQQRKSDPAKVLAEIKPYPAFLVYAYRLWKVEFPDFPGLMVQCRQLQAVLEAASAALLQELVLSLHEGIRPPKPSEVLEVIPGRSSVATIVSVLPLWDKIRRSVSI